MEKETDDIKKMTALINKSKSAYQNNFQLEFQDFVTFKQEPQELSDQDYDEVEDQQNEEDALYMDVEYNTLDLSSQVSITDLTEEERSIIESCSDPDLKKLLILNRTKNMQLIKLHKKVADIKTQCENEIQEKEKVLKCLDSKQTGQPGSIWKLAAPYFKDKKFFASPLNEDAVRRRAKNELTGYDLVAPPKWTPIEFDRLLNAVTFNYNANRQNELARKINALKAESAQDECEDKSKIAEIILLEEELESVKSDSKVPPLNSNDHINWYKVAETFLKDKHTASECQSVWHMLVHPEINKSEWTSEESKNLEVIAKRHNCQNWDTIAAELNTKRTGFTACLHYFSKLCDKFKKSKFTPDEDRFLLELVEAYKIGNFIPWNKVVCHFTNRSRHQLYHRYTYFLSQNHVKKGKFTEAEDILLMVLVNRFGRNFKKCAEFMPHRSQVQLKSRYNSNLQRQIKKGTFTAEDDQIIYEYVQKHGEKNWSGLTTKLNRCNAQIRQRYKLIKAFMAANPDIPLRKIPKRKHGYDKATGEQYNFLNYMADQFRDVDYIPTISMIEESLQVELNNSGNREKSLQGGTEKNPTLDQTKTSIKNIDALLTDVFSNSLVSTPTVNVASDLNIVEAAENVDELLTVLGANLAIPKGFECNIFLDSTDVAILEKLSTKKQSTTECPKVTRLSTPNISTLVGLRSMIIKHKDYKMLQKSKNVPSTSTDEDAMDSSDFSDLDEQTQGEILFHRYLFSKRFDSLFNWSAILSLEKPNHLEIPDLENDRGAKAPAKNKTCVRKSTTSVENPGTAKKRKVDVMSLADLSQKPKDVQNSQLKLVDRSVVEKLMQNKNNVNIIRIETVTGPDGVVRPVLENTKSKVTSKTQSVSGNKKGGARLSKGVEKSDQEALKKLNVVLKSEKDSSYDCQEYQAIKGDVQLLKEILQYEKIKVKPDPDELSS